jgi:hypothetical protein
MGIVRHEAQGLPRLLGYGPLAYAKETLEDGRDDDQEDAGAEPGGSHLVGVGVAGVPGVEDFDGADEADNGADGIEEGAGCVEVTGDRAGGGTDPAGAVAGLGVGAGGEEKEGERTEKAGKDSGGATDTMGAGEHRGDCAGERIGRE